MREVLLTACLLFIQQIAVAQEDVFVYDAHGKYDPFWPLVAPNGSIISYDQKLMAADLFLEGIVVGAQGSNIAIINGKIVKENDGIGDYRVRAIADDYVELFKGDEKFVLTLKKEKI